MSLELGVTYWWTWVRARSMLSPLRGLRCERGAHGGRCRGGGTGLCSGSPRSPQPPVDTLILRNHWEHWGLEGSVLGSLDFLPLTWDLESCLIKHGSPPVILLMPGQEWLGWSWF